MLGECENEIHKLDAETSAQLHQGQVITKVSDVVRELVDNAIDAGAKKVQVLLEDFGLEKIEVRDDGHGIRKDDIPRIIHGGYTSKLFNEEHISRTEDNYGFRGEALASICSFSTTSIFTKTVTDALGISYRFNEKGRIVEEVRGPLPTKSGTYVTVKNLFLKYPVRRNFIKQKSKQISDLKEIENFIRSIGLANHEVSITLIHNGCSIVSKPAAKSIDQALVSILGINISKQMKKIGPVAEPGFQLELFVPKLPVDLRVMAMSSTKMCFIFINRKRVRVKEFETILQHQVLGSIQGTRKYPYAILLLQVPFTEVDFNREIDKSKVFLVKKEEICAKLESILQEYYKVEGIGNIEKLKEAVECRNVKNQYGDVEVIDCTVHSRTESKTPELESERNENVLSFLSAIPTVSNINFTLSPKKTPSFDKTSFGSICSTSTPTTTPNNSFSAVPTYSSNSTQASVCTTPTLANSKDLGLDYSSSTPVRSPNLESESPSNTQKQKDWIYGQMRDSYGGFIQSTTLLTRRETNLSPSSTNGYNNRKSLPNTAASPRDINYNGTARIRSGFESDVSEPPAKRAKPDNAYYNSNGYGNGYTGFKKPDSSFSTPRPTPQRTRLDFDSPAISQGSRPQASKGPRQVTLDSLKNWNAPGDKLAKSANVIYSTPNQTPMIDMLDIDYGNSGEAVICASAERRPSPPQLQSEVVKKNENSFVSLFDVANHETSSRKDIANPGYSRSSEQPTSSAAPHCFKIPESPPIVEFSKTFSTNARNNKICGKAEDAKREDYTSTLGISKSISSFEMVRYPPRLQFCEPLSLSVSQTIQSQDGDESFPILHVISCLPRTNFWIVKINSLIGVFCPLNLLDLEPRLRKELQIPDEEAPTLSVETVKILLNEFIGLSTDDYSEEMVQSLFHVLHDFNGDEEEEETQTPTPASQTQEDTNLEF